MDGSKIRRALPIILGVAGNIGLVGSVFFAIKNTLTCTKELEALDIRAQTEDREVTAKEKFLTIARVYLPTGICALVTLGCNTSGFIISRQTQAKLAAIAAGSTAALTKLQESIKDKLGPEGLKELESHIGEMQSVNDTEEVHPGKRLYHCSYTGYFWADPEKFGLAFNEMNTLLRDGGVTTIYDLFSHAEVEFPDGNKKWNEEAFVLEGWSLEYLSELDCQEGMMLYPIFETDQNEKDIILYTKDGVPFRSFTFGPLPPIWDPAEFIVDRQALYDGGYPNPWNDPRILKFDSEEEKILSDPKNKKTLEKAGILYDEPENGRSEHIY